MGRPWSSSLTTICSLSGLLAGLAAIDPRVRTEIAAIASGQRPSGELISAARNLEDLVIVAMQAVRDQSVEHAPLTIFVLAATLLLAFMLRM